MSEQNSQYPLHIAELIDRIGRLTRELQFVHGLNPAQWETLRFLKRANGQSRTPGCLAEFLCATKGTTSQTVISLENKGLLQRCKDPKDKRKVTLHLTEKGREMLCHDPLRKIEDMVRDMEPTINAALTLGLAQILHQLQEAIGARTFGTCKRCTSFRCRSQHPEEQDICGLTGQPIGEGDNQRVCINFSHGKDCHPFLPEDLEPVLSRQE